MLSLLVPSLPTEFPTAIEHSNVKEKTLYSFINLAMEKSVDLNSDIDNLIKKASLSPDN